MKHKEGAGKGQAEKAFKTAVESTPDIVNCYRKGLQALGTHSKKIALANPLLCDGSIDIDGCTTRLYPEDSRWDYACAYRGKVYFIEVHTASTSEVSKVLKKLQWLKDWLHQRAPLVNELKADSPYYWIQSNGSALLKTSPQFRRIKQAGLTPIPTLKLN